MRKKSLLFLFITLMFFQIYSNTINIVYATSNNEDKDVEEELVIKEVQKRVLDNPIQVKLLIKEYSEDPIPADLIYGGRFMVNGKYYKQEKEFFFKKKYNYINKLENNGNFIRLKYDEDTGLLNIYCDDTQDYCDFNKSKNKIAQIIGYFLVEGYEVSLPDSKLDEDIPVLVYKSTKNNPSEQYIELGSKRKVTFSLTREDGTPMKEKEIKYIYYSCPSELKVPLTFKDDRYLSTYNEASGEATLYYPSNQECIVLSAESTSYRDSEKDVETGNIKFLNNYYTVLGFLKTDGGYLLRNDLIDKVYVDNGKEQFNLIPNRNRYVTERYPSGTKLMLNIKLKDGYETMTTDYYTGYDNKSNTIRVPITINKYSDFDNTIPDEEIEENTFMFAMKETAAETFNKENSGIIKTIVKAVILVIIVILAIFFLKSGVVKKMKQSSEDKKKKETEEYEKMFNEKADWED